MKRSASGEPAVIASEDLTKREVAKVVGERQRRPRDCDLPDLSKLSVGTIERLHAGLL